ncbi:hypothetical protein PC41400_14605 [Paenibacillus chitinolyticus]|uniref:Uncharacterized protein n=1 Tax=Paenibacillus chitinolyticus TaxID=79263 RepID=A0A410WWX7_9BACL|nr:hypothetical protein [Paenibacillus chitinolyticus]MCY9594138.1 hypothetical protein [Paenibacillus chitinolyticus]MCY9599655.1 hypothetical protein [Paenibacillus chitinolyticus]QAV18843.1 hypothetical protein PC41400_14605 [Paenibacillus chitinolyticus]
MLEIDYKPKFYKRKLKGLIQESRGSKFQFEDTLDGGASYILVDQSVEGINNRILDVINGTRDKAYLSHGMRNIDLEKLSNVKWQIWDEFDIYEFEMK